MTLRFSRRLWCFDIVLHFMPELCVQEQGSRTYQVPSCMIQAPGAVATPVSFKQQLLSHRFTFCSVLEGFVSVQIFKSAWPLGHGLAERLLLWCSQTVDARRCSWHHWVVPRCTFAITASSFKAMRYIEVDVWKERYNALFTSFHCSALQKKG